MSGYLRKRGTLIIVPWTQAQSKLHDMYSVSEEEAKDCIKRKQEEDKKRVLTIKPREITVRPKATEPVVKAEPEKMDLAKLDLDALKAIANDNKIFFNDNWKEETLRRKIKECLKDEVK